MPTLPNSPSLADIQNYVTQLEQERGFSEQKVIDKALMLGEEVGELFKAIRKAQGLKMDPNSEVGDIADELADILIFLCSIANRFDVKLEQAFLHKEEKNKKRRWE